MLQPFRILCNFVVFILFIVDAILRFVLFIVSLVTFKVLLRIMKRMKKVKFVDLAKRLWEITLNILFSMNCFLFEATTIICRQWHSLWRVYFIPLARMFYTWHGYRIDIDHTRITHTRRWHAEVCVMDLQKLLKQCYTFVWCWVTAVFWELL